MRDSLHQRLVSTFRHARAMTCIVPLLDILVHLRPHRNHLTARHGGWLWCMTPSTCTSYSMQLGFTCCRLTSYYTPTISCTPSACGSLESRCASLNCRLKLIGQSAKLILARGPVAPKQWHHHLSASSLNGSMVATLSGIMWDPLGSSWDPTHMSMQEAA